MPAGILYQIHELPSVIDLRNWFVLLGQVFRQEIGRETVYNLFWNKCKDMRMTGANVAAMFFHMRSRELESMKDTQL